MITSQTKFRMNNKLYRLLVTVINVYMYFETRMLSAFLETKKKTKKTRGE